MTEKLSKEEWLYEAEELGGIRQALMERELSADDVSDDEVEFKALVKETEKALYAFEIAESAIEKFQNS